MSCHLHAISLRCFSSTNDTYLGLSKDFTANCMHQKGGGSCMVNAGPTGYLFSFLGGPPGWEVNKQAATKETRILISPDGTRVVNVEYNGAPR